MHRSSCALLMMSVLLLCGNMKSTRLGTNIVSRVMAFARIGRACIFTKEKIVF